MSWLETLAFVPRPPDSRPIREIEQEILDELEFHVEMRTLDNVAPGCRPPKPGKTRSAVSAILRRFARHVVKPY